ncbi:MAG TPA: S8 family serine peptidase, partial [Thermomonospora sp.]|nr:S8 family serine peptidase [Thermomonospora sp.]
MAAVMARVGAAVAAVALALTPVLAPAPARADVVRERQRPILDALDVPDAWKITKGRGVTVAVVDSGVDPGHRDLRGSVTVGPNMLADLDRAGPPARAHGTGMASLIAGHGHGPGGRDGVIGIAPEARILALRVIAEPRDPGFPAFRTSERSKEAVARGIRYAADHGADVINLSLGSHRESPGEREAVAYAIAKGVVVVSAVGNDGDKRHQLDDKGFAPYSYPASYPGVIAVAATTPGHKRAPFSNRNYSVLLSAPGVGIPSAGPGGDYFLTEGTSDASALVSGIAALIRARHPEMRPSLVRQALLASTRFGPTGRYDPSVGFGEVNAAAALRAAAGLATTPRGTGALSSGRRFDDRELGPVKVIDRPFWTRPVAYGAILLTIAGAGTAFAVTV